MNLLVHIRHIELKIIIMLCCILRSNNKFIENAKNVLKTNILTKGLDINKGTVILFTCVVINKH